MNKSISEKALHELHVFVAQMNKKYAHKIKEMRKKDKESKGSIA